LRGVSKVEENFRGDRPIVPINRYDPRDYAPALDFGRMDEDYREALEVAICTLLDHDGGRLIITGDSQTGKTFFGAQILYSAEQFLGNYGLGDFFPLRITQSDYNEIAPYTDSIGDYLHRVASELNIDISELCIFTDNPQVAGRIAESGVGVKMVFEAPHPMYQSMMNAQNSGATSVWSGWSVIDISGVFLRRRAIVDMVYAAQADRLADGSSVPLKKKHIIAIVNQLLEICDAMRHEEGEPKNPYLVVAPSHVAMLTRRLIQLVSIEFKDAQDVSPEDLKKAIAKVFEHLEPLIERVHQQAHSIANDLEDDGPTMISVAAGSPEEARAALEAMGLQLSEEQEDDLFEDFVKERSDSKKSTFRGKFRSIGTLEKSLKKTIIGQDRAINKVVDALAIPAAGMHSPKKPLRTMLFLGPTGVGKTELSLQLAENLYTDPLNVIRLDMSEFSTEGATTSLFGSTPGYIGYSEDGGMLTREVAKNPHSLIILDEIEKAKPSTWDAFLQVLDAGRMTTGSGKVVDFSNCVIVMTSNLGTEEMSARGIGFGELGETTKSPEQLERIAKTALKKYFRIEFLNRIDEIVVFDQLGSDSARKIVEKELREVSKLIGDRGHSLAKSSTDILDSILKSSDFDQFGAREIQRTVQRKVSMPLARLVLDAGKKPKKFKLQKSEDSTFSVTEA